MRPERSSCGVGRRGPHTLQGPFSVLIPSELVGTEDVSLSSSFSSLPLRSFSQQIPGCLGRARWAVLRSCWGRGSSLGAEGC